MYNITCEPQPGMNGRTYSLLAAHVVGGGTVVNGMAFDRGSAGDYDLWEDLGNPGWGWKGLFPYFKKVGFLSFSLSGTSSRSLPQRNRVKPILLRRRASFRIMRFSMIPQHTDLQVPSRLPCHHSSSLPFVSCTGFIYYGWRFLTCGFPC